MAEQHLTDPFEAALAAAELDDEPYTEADRAAAAAAWAAYQRGESAPLRRCVGGCSRTTTIARGWRDA